jgi:hypothetical protein
MSSTGFIRFVVDLDSNIGALGDKAALDEVKKFVSRILVAIQ